MTAQLKKMCIPGNEVLSPSSTLGCSQWMHKMKQVWGWTWCMIPKSTGVSVQDNNVR